MDIFYNITNQYRVTEKGARDTNSPLLRYREQPVWWLHLVDEIGTLEDAVNYAALCAGDVDLSNWRVTGYPKAQTQMEQILEMFSGSSDEEGVLLGEFRRISEPTVMARMDTRIEISAD